MHLINKTLAHFKKLHTATGDRRESVDDGTYISQSALHIAEFSPFSPTP